MSRLKAAPALGAPEHPSLDPTADNPRFCRSPVMRAPGGDSVEWRSSAFRRRPARRLEPIPDDL